jgi:hypothetical protein
MARREGENEEKRGEREGRTTEIHDRGDKEAVVSRAGPAHESSVLTFHIILLSRTA